MHEVAGHHRALALREDVDAAMAGRMPRRRRQRDRVVERIVVVDQNRLPRFHDRQAIVAKHRARRVRALGILRFPRGIFPLVEYVFRVGKRRHPAPVAQRRVPAGVVDVQMGAKDVVDLLKADAEREQFVAPAFLAGKIERRRMPLVLAGAGIDQDRVARRSHDEGLVGDEHLAGGDVEHLRLHAGEMMLENGVVIGREEILRSPPRPLALDHRVDGDVADPQLLHCCFAPTFLRERIGRRPLVQAGQPDRPAGTTNGK